MVNFNKINKFYKFGATKKISFHSRNMDEKEVDPQNNTLAIENFK
jgi:hypothetical protein